jgi:hypothetical protein
MTKEIIPVSIDSISPTSGAPGTPVLITGRGFISGNNIHGIFFNDVAADGWVLNDDGSLTVPAPVGHPAFANSEPLSGTVALTVKTEGGPDNFGGDVQVSNAAPFTYLGK